MIENIKFKENEKELIIEIVPKIKPIIMFGLIFQGLIIIGCSLFFAFLIFKIVDKMPIGACIIIAFAALYFTVGKKYLNRVFYREIIIVTKEELTIIDKYLLSKKLNAFPIDKISNINFVGKQNYTKHPLDNETMDVTGFGVVEREIQFIIEDGTIEIFCEGLTRRFGKKIPSWDAEEIVRRIESFTGNNLHLDDKTEKLFEEFDKNEIAIS